MKNLFLLGDSIRIGYDKSVRATLGDRANVIFPDDNCRFAVYLLRYFHEYLGGVRGDSIDVVHWNAGLWDCLRLLGDDPITPIDFYSYYIDKLCLRIRTVCPNAKVIFATSTSVLSEKMAPYFKRYNEEIEAYNAAAVAVVQKYGFAVNDLYSLSCRLPEEAHSDNVHYYTSMGTEAFTKQVLSHVLPALGIEEELPYREELYVKKPIGM